MKSKRIMVEMSSAQYPIIVGFDLDRELKTQLKKLHASRIAIIADSTVKRLWGTSLIRTCQKTGLGVELFSFSAGEQNKNQQNATALQHALLKRRFGRDTVIVAVGGGVVGDLAGFVAATYMRGIPYIHVPTTLLAMVDSSIGGKVGIDTPQGKNTVGAFWHPKAVISDLRYLEALPKKQLVSGLLEAVKSFLTSEPALLTLAQKLHLDDPMKTKEVLFKLVSAAIQFKSHIVSRDEREQNERRVLNFGHTIGHAIELLSGFKMPHGYAVGYGVLVESKIAELLKILSPADFLFVREYLAGFGITEHGLSRFTAAKILEAAKADKKALGGKLYYVLLSGIGSVYQANGQYAHSVDDSIVRQAFNSLCSKKK